MRIAFVSVSDQLGGSETVLLQLLDQLRRLRPGWELHLVLPGAGPLAEAAEARGVRIHPLPMPSSLSRIGEWSGGGRVGSVLAQLGAAAGDYPSYQRRFAATMASIDPDVIHSNGFKAHIVAARISTHAARLWHIHEYLSRRRVTRSLLRRYADRCDGVVVNSASVAADVVVALGSRLRRPPAVVLNGVDLERFHPDGPAADLDAMCGLPFSPETAIRVGLVATFARWKGHQVFLRALARLPDHLPLRAYVIGGALYDTTGSQWSLAELRDSARTLGVGARVAFTGFQRSMPDVMRALDIVVHASTDPEPFGLVIAEAMACGRAVLTSGTGGAAEIVEHGSTVLVHEPGDDCALARDIQTLVAEPVTRRRLGSAARASAERHLDAGRVGDAFVSLYETVAKERALCR